MSLFSRLMSHPAIVTALSTGAVYTDAMRKEKEENDTLLRNLAMKRYDYQLAHADDDVKAAKVAEKDALDFTRQQYSNAMSQEKYGLAGDIGSGLPGPMGIDATQRASDMDVDAQRALAAQTEERERTAFEEKLTKGLSGNGSEQETYYTALKDEYKDKPYVYRADGFLARATLAKKEEAAKEKAISVLDQQRQKNEWSEAEAYKIRTNRSLSPGQWIDEGIRLGLSSAGLKLLDLATVESRTQLSPVQVGIKARQDDLERQRAAQIHAAYEKNKFEPFF